jgi:hypothetical protein
MPAPTHPPTPRNDEYLAPSKAKAIQKLMQQLCSEVWGRLRRRGEGVPRKAVCGLRPAPRNGLTPRPTHACPLRDKPLSPTPQLRSVALPLVSAWGVPDHILRAPIGLGSHSGVDIYKEYLTAVGFDV